MEFELDARRLNCPEPVLRTKAALEQGERSLAVMVDNATARDNVSRFARTSGCDVEVEQQDYGFLIKVEKRPDYKASGEPVTCDVTGMRTVFFISGDELGKGERELGHSLMKAFLYAATQCDEPPSSMVFMNSGVRLVTENEETVAHVKELEEKGVEVVACGTCLDYYGLKEDLKIGRVSNMYEIQGILMDADRLVTL
jgi:selenium metabolism protein YedF